MEKILLNKDTIKVVDHLKLEVKLNLKKKNGRSTLIIKSIPYQVNKSILNEKIAQLAREKKIEGISDIRDESNREGIRVVLELKKGVEPETIRRQLYKFTKY